MEPRAEAAASQVVLERVEPGRQILAAVGQRRPFGELLSLVFIGLFFNTFLPTSVGGDLVRGYYTSRGREGLGASYSALLVERALGFTALAAVALVASLFPLASPEPPLPRAALGAVAAGSAGLVAAGVLVFAWRGLAARLRARTAEGGRLARTLGGLAVGLDLFHRPATPRLAIVVASVALQVVAVLFHVACARAVGLDVPTVAFFVVVPLSVVASMAPVSLNGLGLREGTLVGMLVAWGAPAAAAGAFALLALVVSTAFSLIGGLLYPFYRAPAAEAADVRTPT